MMKTLLSIGAVALGLIVMQATQSRAQEPAKDAKTPDAKGADAKPGADAPKEESSVTEHSIKIDGQTISYKATASTTLLKDAKGEPTALIFSTAYSRSDAKDMSVRPLAFIYNGGPGSASIWLHMGAFGPRRVVTANATQTPPPPYKLVDNIGCLLDKADLVFIDPVGTGFSRAVGKAEGKDFWGVDQDVKSLAEFISIYINRNNRWNSPKFLIGESYGTFRSAALGNFLQSSKGIYINGIVLISSVLDVATLQFATGDDRSYMFYLPSYAAAAAYYKLLKEPPSDLTAFLVEVRKFASTEYAEALMKGSQLGDAEKAGVAKKLSHYTGLSEDFLVKADLRVNLSQFNAELERSRGLTIGRYDARYSGPTIDLLTENSEYDPSYTAVSGAFTAAFNVYCREELKYSPERNYETLSGEPGRNWDWKHNGGRGFGGGASNVEGDLAQALLTNPHLQVEVENGLFDQATPFFATEYTMDHLGIPSNLRTHIHLNYYESGHMIYLHEVDLAKLRANVANFIENASR
jgi:carboxypeptidase C (cathepsin A)